MTTKIKAAEHLDEIELNKLLKYLLKSENWTYYILVKLGISTALRYSDLSRITWEDVLNKETLVLKERKTGKTREIPIGKELQDTLRMVHRKLGNPKGEKQIIPLTIRGVNKQLKIIAERCGLKSKRLSTHSFRKSFGREVWKRNNYSEAALIKLSYLFNHSNTSITRVYLDITREEVSDLYSIQDLFVY